MSLKLGKQNYEFDERTLRLSSAISPTVVFPHRFDFDKGRAAFPIEMWGNDSWGNCVKVAQANEILRLERIEQHRTLKIGVTDVVAEYKRQTGSASPGDSKDHGLVMLDNNRRWRTDGFHLGKRSYKIAAFGELEPSEIDQLKAAIYLLHGVQFGFALPRAAQWMTDQGKWDVNGDRDPEYSPGSWGGHAVFCKAYDEGGFEVLTWGKKVYVTNAFVKRYCDEAWAVVDSFNTWKMRPEINVDAIIQHLQEIGATGIEK